MIDIRLIRENPEQVRERAASKGVTVPTDEILRLDEERRRLLTQVNTLRSEQKALSSQIGQQPENKAQLIGQMKEVSQQIEELENSLTQTEESLTAQLMQIPNLPDEGVPQGKDESGNVVLRKWREPRQFDFEPKDHVALGEALEMIDIPRAAKVSGARFYYLKNEAVLLEFALVQFAIQTLLQEGFTPVIPPTLAREEILYAMGYLPSADTEMYRTTLDGLRLVATAEHTLGPLHRDEILRAEELPLRYGGFSSCFRREAGSYGKDTRGILRVHQFDKVEMFSFCREEESRQEHEYLVSLEERITQALDIPYRVVMMCTGDLGVPAARKYDIEMFMPGQGRYRETHSCSNCTDFQARRLNIRYRETKGPTQFVHTLNGTAVAVGRTLIAIMENYQQPDGSILIPQVLRPFMGIEKISPK